jgi:beta-galactosidase
MSCSGKAHRAWPDTAEDKGSRGLAAWALTMMMVCVLLLAGCSDGGGGGGNDPPAAVLPAVATQPAAQTVEAGQPATFSVTLSAGTEPVRYQWLRDGSAVTGATGASFTLPGTAESDNGARFQVQVSNAAGSVTSAQALLTVQPRPAVPVLSSVPQALTVIEGQAAAFSVDASSNAGAISYQWLRGSEPIVGATAAGYSVAAATPADDGAL